jgi:hypothetical protein
LPISIGQVNKHRDVLARCDCWKSTAVCGFEDEGDHVVRFLDTAYHPVRARRFRGIHTGLLVKPGFLSDQLEGKEPIDLAPAGGDFWCHGVAKNLTDRGEQMLSDNRVLFRADAEGHMLVRDATHDVIKRWRLRIDQLHCVRNN